MKRGTVHIAPGPLDSDLARLSELQRQAGQLLSDLEQKVGYVGATFGGWRHDPVTWLAETTSRPRPLT